jgi:nucleotide-binding universal stress UspA family protein
LDGQSALAGTIQPGGEGDALNAVAGETVSLIALVAVLARDGDRARLGPKSLGKTTRFVVDHAACPVLLVWPGSAPDVATIPPPPHHPSPPDS